MMTLKSTLPGIAGLLAMAAGCSSTPTTTIKVVDATSTGESASAVMPEPGPGAAPVEQDVATPNVMRVTFAEEGSDFDPSTTPDGSRIVYASTQHRRTSDLYIKRVDSHVVTQLTNDPSDDANPSVSPDGKTVAFASNRAGNWDIYVMPLDGGKAVQITGESSDEIQPSWSPDGRQLVFSRHSDSSGRWEMWTCEVENPARSQFIGYGLSPRWCPVAGSGTKGADRILFQLGRERGRRTFSLWTIDLRDGVASNATEIASSATTALINPCWSRDGKWIVYSEVPAPEGVMANARPTEATLWMIGVEGEMKVRLTSGAGVALSPSWAKTDRLFFVSDRSGMDNIWSMNTGEATLSAMSAGTGAPVANVPEQK